MKKKIFLGLIAIVIIAIAVAWCSFEAIVKKAVNKIGSQVVGTEVVLKSFNLSPFAGSASIGGFTIANPKNYKSPYLLSLGGVSVKLDVKSLFSNTIIINDITVNKPVITYEMLSLTQNNIKQLQENIAKNSAPSTAQTKKEKTEAPKDKNKEKTSSKNVIIKKVTIKEGELKAVTAIPGDEGLIDVKLPEITLTDIGAPKGNKKGENIITSFVKILNKILSVATETVVKDGLQNIKGVAEKNLNNVVGEVKDKIKNLGIFGK